MWLANYGAVIVARNEEAVGAAIKKSGVPREELCIVAKVVHCIVQKTAPETVGQKCLMHA